MIELFGAWQSFQRELVAFNQAQMDRAGKAVGVGNDIVAANLATTEAVRANWKAWTGWLDLWGIR